MSFDTGDPPRWPHMGTIAAMRIICGKVAGSGTSTLVIAPVPLPAPGAGLPKFYTRSRAKIEDLVEFSLAAAQLNNTPASISVGVVKLPSVI